jgi:ORF6N domain-containing protein
MRDRPTGTGQSPPTVDQISGTILVLQRQRVILDADLASLYGVSTKRLNEQVKRNAARFPEDFMFRLSAQETEALNRSQNATGSQKHRDPRFARLAFCLYLSTPSLLLAQQGARQVLGDYAIIPSRNRWFAAHARVRAAQGVAGVVGVLGGPIARVVERVDHLVASAVFEARRKLTSRCMSPTARDVNLFPGKSVEKYRISATDYDWKFSVVQYPEGLAGQLPDNFVRQENSVELISI